MSDYDLGSHLIGGEDFGGDNRSFSYDQGTSRAEITDRGLPARTGTPALIDRGTSRE